MFAFWVGAFVGVVVFTCALVGAFWTWTRRDRLLRAARPSIIERATACTVALPRPSLPIPLHVWRRAQRPPMLYTEDLN